MKPSTNVTFIATRYIRDAPVRQNNENRIVLPAPNLSVILPVLGPSRNKGTAQSETKAVASVFDNANSCFHDGKIGTMNAYPRKSTRKAQDNAQKAHFFSVSFILPHPPWEGRKLHPPTFL